MIVWKRWVELPNCCGCFDICYLGEGCHYVNDRKVEDVRETGQAMLKGIKVEDIAGMKEPLNGIACGVVVASIVGCDTKELGNVVVS